MSYRLEAALTVLAVQEILTACCSAECTIEPFTRDHRCPQILSTSSCLGALEPKGYVENLIAHGRITPAMTDHEVRLSRLMMPGFLMNRTHPCLNFFAFAERRLRRHYQGEEMLLTGPKETLGGSEV